MHANKAPARYKLPATEQLLVDGGDARITLDPDHGLNKYGCSPLPDPGLVALGSSTASGISEAGFAAAERFRGRLLHAVESESPAAICARELNRIRQEFVSLCGVSDIHGLDVVFAASGTDLHLIAAQIGCSAEPGSMLAIMVEAAETGSGVPAALAGRHFSRRAALGDDVIEGNSITGDVVANDGAITGGGMMEVATVPIRLADGTPRQIAEIDAEFGSLAARAVTAGQRVILVLADVSKTGMIAPSPACALALQRGLHGRVDVLVDACQFRIAPPTLRAYLAQGFLVALTGSKFVTGPPFSGALLIPSLAAGRMRRKQVPRALSAYSTRADWPEGWDTAGLPENVANFGLLLRWEAALEELRMFRSVPEAEVENFLQRFARAIHERLNNDPLFEPLAVPRLDRYPLMEAASWDRTQTIFPFLIFYPPSHAGKKPLSREQTTRIYRLLQLDLNDCREGMPQLGGALAALRCQFGQPVECGNRDGVPVSVLRLCASARLVIEATAQEGRNASNVIGKALAALDKAALLIRSIF